MKGVNGIFKKHTRIKFEISGDVMFGDIIDVEPDKKAPFDYIVILRDGSLRKIKHADVKAII